MSCKSYTKRDKYFKYLDLQLYDEPQEDAKRYFRITNRFINQALASGGKILVHSIEGKSRCAAFILAYLISQEGIKLKDGLMILRQFVGEVEPNEGFMQQLAQYDLELLSEDQWKFKKRAPKYSNKIYFSIQGNKARVVVVSESWNLLSPLLVCIIQIYRKIDEI